MEKKTSKLYYKWNPLLFKVTKRLPETTENLRSWDKRNPSMLIRKIISHFDNQRLQKNSFLSKLLQLSGISKKSFLPSALPIMRGRRRPKLHRRSRRVLQKGKIAVLHEMEINYEQMKLSQQMLLCWVWGDSRRRDCLPWNLSRFSLFLSRRKIRTRFSLFRTLSCVLIFQ